ncbi:MAG: hypothetical protein JWM56_479 [Candidatus Peribacteria bacterium]|nr:hypothetical protein [Candidatus Peribacteria bacterium]
MPTLNRPGIIDILRGSFEFYRKHSALNWVMLWLMILPGIGLNLLKSLLKYGTVNVPNYQSQLPLRIVIGVGALALIIIVLWGTASVMVIGKRQIQNKAGRARTSFKTVRQESRILVGRLFFTNVIQTYTALYYSLLFTVPALMYLLIHPTCQIQSKNWQATTSCLWPVLLMTPLLIPALVYLLRTIFYGVIIATEDKAYREALRRSMEVTKGSLLYILTIVLGLAIIMYVPVLALVSVLQILAGTSMNLITSTLLSILDNSLHSFGCMLMILSVVSLYGILRDGGAKEEPKPLGRPKKGETRTKIKEVKPSSRSRSSK